MNSMLRHLKTAGLTLVLLTGLSGCVVGPGYDGGPDVGVNYDVGVDVPLVVGGWGPGYYVGPGRGGDRRGDAHASHSYRAAPQSRSTPSIPRGSNPHHH
jgi:hypothetical protein